MTIVELRPGRATVSSADLLAGVEAARRVAAKFARRVNCWHRLDEYVGAALEVVAKASLSHDPSLDIPFAAWAATRAQGAVIDEHRRWYGRGEANYREEALSLDWDDLADEYLPMPSRDDPEREVIDLDTARRALDALDAFDAVHRLPRHGIRSPSTRSVVLGSAAGVSHAEMAGGTCNDSRISQILKAGRVLVTSVMAADDNEEEPSWP